MATHIDNSKNMSTTDVKNVLINTFKRSAEKSVQDAGYDKTILATIQYCSDATIGQYKIKYQNGYFTAYSRDTNTIYTNKASVYVLVPGNNMNNRMFITGLATNDNSQKAYATNLEMDQTYMKDSINFITVVNEDINMSSYWDAPNTYTKVLYQYGQESNIINLDDKVYTYVKNCGGALRFGASFKTAFTDDRKVSGDYGIRLCIRYNNNILKDYEINTFNMIGSPFNFTSYMAQYNYWDIDVDNFVRIESITEYMTGFPEGIPPEDVNFRDIFIKDLSIHTATKLYDETNNKYRVEITAERGKIFSVSDTPNDYLTFVGKLKVDGNYVQDSTQNLEIYWGKEDVSVNRNNVKYNSHLKNGWYCLNTANKKSYDSESVQDLKNDYTITAEDIPDANTEFEWNSSDNISVKKKMCPGKTTKLRCVIVYQGVDYFQDIEIINESGLYILLKEDNDKTEFYNGSGYATITAGVFQDTGDDIPTNVTLQSSPYDITYKWVEVDSLKNKTTLPDFNTNEILTSYAEWDSTRDNETLDDATVQEYLNAYPVAAKCRQRYDYYNDKYQSYVRSGQTEDQSTQGTYMKRAHTRSSNILSERKTDIYAMYTSTATNEAGYTILGPAQVTAKYTSSTHDYTSAEIDTITHYWYSDVPGSQYQQNKTKMNSVYRISIGKITESATYKVTAFITQDGITQSIETKEITLTNTSGSTLNYHLEITNGIQSFLYTEGGKSPTANTSTGSGYALSPLTFRLYNQSGELLCDSAVDSQETREFITMLHPTWTWSDSSYSLLTTQYKGSTNCSTSSDDVTKLQLENESRFVYGLKDDFNVNLIDNSNVQLKVYYSDQAIFAETDFTFIKQGELGTNGTDTYLYMKDPAYEIYKNDVLADDQWCKFDNNDGDVVTVDTFTPKQRHLGDTYMFATKCYDDSLREIDELSDAQYVNLAFANSASTGSAHDKGIGVVGSSTATLKGYWSENGNVEAVANNNTSKWTANDVDSGYLSDGTKVYTTPPYKLNTFTGSSVILSMDYVNNQPPFVYKPTTIQHYSPNGSNGQTYERTSNCVIKLEAQREIAAQLDPVTNERIKRKNYGYYQIPYFYFNYGQNTSDIDPARHIVIVGGYDEVIYDSAGYNPEYNKQNPFKFYLFDENNKDITQDLIAAARNGNATIQWKCSEGFTLKCVDGSNNGGSVFINYSEFGNDVQLLDKYCTYEGNSYHCIKDYTKSQTIKIVSDDRAETIYNPGDFVTPYWEKIDINTMLHQEKKLIPDVGYNSIVNSNLFNSWISVYIRWRKSVNKDYTAECLIPINVLCNRYGSEEMNGWDGKKTKVGDAYIISNKVAAGRKYEDNSFVGVTMGETFYPDNNTRDNEIGLFGYGRTDKNNPNTWSRTFFMDAESGKLILGPSGSAQIFINPKITVDGSKENWSRLAGWYISPNYFYKPLREGANTEITFDDLSKLNGEDAISTKLDNLQKGSAGLYVPWSKEALDDDVFIWAANNRDITYKSSKEDKRTKSQFAVTYGGHLYCQDADVKGIIKADGGYFGGEKPNNIKISYTDTNNNNYILYNPKFWVKDTGNDVDLYMKGKIMASSGQFGEVDDTKDGKSTDVLFIAYTWYPWNYPDERSAWDDDHFYLDESQGRNTVYPIYHPNFHMTTDGEVVINGKGYFKSGRLGNWVISDPTETDEKAERRRGSLVDIHDTIMLHPSKSFEDDSFIQVGHIILEGKGDITGYGEDEHGELDPENILWKINKNGTATFTSPSSTFVGTTYSTTSSGATLTSSGCSFSNGTQLTSSGLTIADSNGNTVDLINTSGVTITNGSISVGGDGTGTHSNAIVNIGETGISLRAGTLSDEYSIGSDGVATLYSLTIDGRDLQGGSLDLGGGWLSNACLNTGTIKAGSTTKSLSEWILIDLLKPILENATISGFVTLPDVNNWSDAKGQLLSLQSGEINWNI